ncbi:MAG: type II toxin-antitoxin system ParD family antitoxin [Rhizobium sp.]|nr:type II toxin-antitoxin system ParD family antitoxin [Rhizobium sp.]
MNEDHPSKSTVLLELEAQEAAFIDREISRGAYARAEDLLRAGLHLLESSGRERRIAELRAMIDEADADVEAGHFREFGAPGELADYIKEQAKARR